MIVDQLFVQRLHIV